VILHNELTDVLMPDKSTKSAPRLSEKGRQAQVAREERRAELLRQNLLKRKAHQRSRSNDGGAKDA
tara:strand:+ start:104 stop:301 length:198 start_codon:yes stop_codon:yes gene_type:complete